jgi:hypothetical protein
MIDLLCDGDQQSNDWKTNNETSGESPKFAVVRIPANLFEGIDHVGETRVNRD